MEGRTCGQGERFHGTLPASAGGPIIIVNVVLMRLPLLKIL